LMFVANLGGASAIVDGISLDAEVAAVNAGIEITRCSRSGS
jgi:hypothetical protein